MIVVATFRAFLALVLASLATLVIVGALPAALFAMVSGEERRYAGSVLAAFVLFGSPALFVYGLLWMPVLALCRSVSYDAREWGVVRAPMPLVLLILGYPVATGFERLDSIGVMGFLVFGAPVAMLQSALFFYFDRRLSPKQSNRT